jgi:glyoxylase-like metal-dependent hydrolase (beta-lactamase superfamily II)
MPLTLKQPGGQHPREPAAVRLGLPAGQDPAENLGRGQLPRAPEAIPVPGHTPGSTAFAWPAYGALFTGDALVTADGLSGGTGPRLVSRGFTHDSGAARDSLSEIGRLDGYPVLLPGHGEPLTAGAATAAAEALRANVT